VKKSHSTLVYLRWFDSSIFKGEMCSLEETDIGIHEMESAGLLVAEDKESVTLALDRSVTNRGLRLLLCVPRVNIRKIKKFKVVI
jgi:hypothetical protein